MTNDVLVTEHRKLPEPMEALLSELNAGTMNLSAALARIGNRAGNAVYGLALQHFSDTASRTIVTWSRSGQEPQRVRKTLIDRLRMGGILEVECSEQINLPVTKSVIQFAIRGENDEQIGSLTAFVQHQELGAEHCRMLCDLATVFSLRFTRDAIIR